MALDGGGPIFVGGTGRSGTTLLTEVLGTHPQIWSVPVESRLLIDPDGLCDLVDAVSHRWTVGGSHTAVVRFAEFALADLASPHEPPYRGADLANIVGRSHYERTIQDFIRSLVVSDYEIDIDYWTETKVVTRARNLARLASGVAHGLSDLRQDPRSFLSFKWHRPYTPMGRRRYLVRYFDRASIVELAATMVDSLFSRPMNAAGKQTWCEKTPHNILSLPSLAELFPRATFIHIKRDPRAVVWSLSQQPFAPRDVTQSSLWLREVLKRWLDEKFRPDRYFEIELEALEADPLGALGPAMEAAGVDPKWEGLPLIERTKVDHWQAEMSGDDRRRIEEILGDLILQMGYNL